MLLTKWIGPRVEKEGSYYAIRCKVVPIRLKPLLITDHFDGNFLVTNEYACCQPGQMSHDLQIRTCETHL